MSQMVLLTSKIGPDEIHLYRSNNHFRNFLDCVRNRKDPVASVEIGHRSVSLSHLGNIAMRLKAKLHWDPAAERCTNSNEANQMLSKPMRSPWRL